MSLMIIHVYVFEHKPSNFIDRNLFNELHRKNKLIKKISNEYKKKTYQ